MIGIRKIIRQLLRQRFLYGVLTFSALLFSFPKVYSAILSVHEHGVAHLFVVQQEGQVALTLTSPWHNLLGFEHAPTSEKEKQAEQQLLTELQKADAFFLFNKSAQCSLMHQKIFDGDLHNYQEDHHEGTHNEDNHHEKKHHEEEAQHRDLTAEYVFICAIPSVLQQINMRALLQRFSGIKKLNVQWVSDNRQFVATLTTDDSILNLVP
ncbi:hypothetical protein CI610_02195 [invertebrate metagenome]|uniref:DUF2796 domain-containing protein n=1 Tax=invertebrate metagenome TaxID=1711999 RepID=A0A2H9T6M7_9ZZZZ